MSWQLFDRLSAYFRRINVYRQQNLYTDQSSLDRVISGAEFLNNAQTLHNTNMQMNRLQRYIDFDQMATVGEIVLSLDMYADEASLIDPEIKHNIVIKAGSLRVKKELENLFYNTLMLDNQLRPIARYLCKYGDYAAEIVPTKNRDGVSSIRFMNMYNFSRVETKSQDLVGFYYQDQLSQTPQFFHPWNVVHMRLATFDSNLMPYGSSILDGARKHYRQLRLMEDSAIVYRLVRAPEKRVFTIPVGNIPTNEVPNYIQLISRQFKKKQFFDPATGEVNERYWPQITDDDIWLPARADGTGPQVTQLKGADNLGEITDIEYFKKKMLSALKIPFSRVGIGESSENDSKPLSSTSPDFAKAVQWIQRELATGLKKVAMVHLALRGFSGEDIKNFDIHMTASSAIDELYRIETWSTRAELIKSLKDTALFPDKWIIQRFTNLTDDEIEEMKEEQQDAMVAMFNGMGAPGGAPGGMPGMDAGTLPPPPGGAPGGPPAGLNAPVGLSMEGYDQKQEKAMLTELTKFIKNSDNSRIINEQQIYTNNGFEFMLNSGELDGLRDSENNMLVENVINETLIKETLSEHLNLIKSQQNLVVDADEEIDIGDLPL